MERCLDSCCWAYRPIEWAYSGEKGRAPTMRDRLSPADVRTIIDRACRCLWRRACVPVCVSVRFLTHVTAPPPPSNPVHHDLDGGARPEWLNLTFLSEAMLPCLQPGTVIMVEGWQKGSFVQQASWGGGIFAVLAVCGGVRQIVKGPMRLALPASPGPCAHAGGI